MLATMNTVLCPHCKKTVEISEALKHQFDSEEKAKIEAEFQKKFEFEKNDAVKDSARKLQEQFEHQIKIANEDSVEKDLRIKKLLDQLTELTQELRKSKQERDEVKLDMQKKLAEEEDKIRLEERKKAEEEQRLKFLENEKKLQDAIKVNEELKRKLEQGSQQTQGEVFELAFEELLQKEFPHDKIKPVPKGIRGADIIQEVWDARGNYNGMILWELKNTKPPWKEDWADTLKKNKRSINADVAILITEVLPKEIKTAGYRDGIWITEKAFVVGMASAQRASLIQMYYVKESSKGKEEKIEILYAYLSGVEFKHRIEAIIEAFTRMQKDIEKEKRYFASKWASDEKNLRQVIDNTIGMHGDFKGIIGQNLQMIKGVDLPELDDGDN